MTLSELLKNKIKEWRKADYPCKFSTIQEILEYASINTKTGEKKLRYLRPLQRHRKFGGDDGTDQNGFAGTHCQSQDVTRVV